MEGLSLGQVGCRLLAQLLRGDAQVARQLSQVMAVPLHLGGKAAQKDLMPFPLPPFGAPEQAAAAAERVPDGTVVRQWEVKVWMTLALHALNSLHEGRERDFKVDAAQWMRNGEPGAAQRKALRMIEDYVSHFLREGVVPTTNWKQTLKKLQLSYTGEEVKTAQMLTAATVLPGLPPQGAAASIRAADLAEGPVRQYLLDPQSLFTPEETWPEELPSPKVFAEDKDWVEVVRLCVWNGVFWAFASGRGVRASWKDAAQRRFRRHQEPGGSSPRHVRPRWG